MYSNPPGGAQFEADKEAEATTAFARLIWDTALLESGFDIEAPKEFNARVYGLLARAHGIAPADLAMSEETAAAAAAEVRARPWLASLFFWLLPRLCRSMLPAVHLCYFVQMLRCMLC